MRYIWKIKINGQIQAKGSCPSKEDVMSESEHYFLEFSEEDWDKIVLEVERKGEK